MKKIVGLAAVAALLLAACTSAPTATETGVPTPPPSAATTTGDPCTKDFIAQNGITVADKQPGDVLARGPWIDNQKKHPGVGMQKVLYVSTLRDADDLVPVCGAVYRAKQPNLVPGTPQDPNKVLMWTHGTVGLRQECMPSTAKVLSLTQEPQSGGLGAQLTQFLAEGYTVLAPDYYAGLGEYPFQPYVAGAPQARNALDMVRAEFPDGSNFSVWGHSQGGGASLWVGQLATTYLPEQFDIKSVVAAAPASQLTAAPGQKYVGFHMGNRNAYNYVGLVPLGPILFSYVLGSWAGLSEPASSGVLAAGPNMPVDVASATTAAGARTVKQMSSFCINLIQSSLVNDAKLVEALRVYDANPAAKAFFAKPFSGDFLPFYPSQSTAAIDEVCSGQLDATAPLKAWCSWLTWNNPGPNGTSDMPKYALDRAGEHVPTFIAQGLADNVVWCMADTPASGDLPKPEDCLASQLVESMRANESGVNLETAWYPGANHFAVMAQSAQKSADFIRAHQ